MEMNDRAKLSAFAQEIRKLRHKISVLQEAAGQASEESRAFDSECQEMFAIVNANHERTKIYG